MRIGVPREIKPLEGRVGLIPAACSELVTAGHQVYIESGGGVRSGYSDQAYRAAGAKITADAVELYELGELIVKVKEPVEGDLRYLRSDHILFSYLHLAANEALTRTLCGIGLTALAFETVQLASGDLPLLAPMSDIAGRLIRTAGYPFIAPAPGRQGPVAGRPAGRRERACDGDWWRYGGR